MPDIAFRRWLFLVLVLASSALGSLQLWSLLRIDGLSVPEFLFLALFTILFGWIAASFWIALFGAWAKLSGARLPLKEASGASRSRTAILMPVYNEDVAQVFSAIQAMHRSLCDAGEKGFDFYILSDSTDPAHWIAEEVEWQSLRASLRTAGPGLFYRHRHHNIGRKSGNIQDFCENWGALYDYMVVLDADSLMSGECLGRLVRLMDANPRAALIQAPPQLAGRRSLFARIQQFASSVYGPMHSAGLAALQAGEGNYWGHNAIIRIRAFMAHCGLPSLPGKPPFGGEIMSHDFVEAAFLVRAGWEVWMAPDLGGSFEEPPPTIFDFLKRDRRWCQGNLQHLRILFAQGLKMPSRLHLAMGIMSYLSSPLWLFLLIVSAFALGAVPAAMPFHYWGPNPALDLAVSHSAEFLQLGAATLMLLYGPKLAAVLLAWRDPALRRAHGGGRALLRSLVLESVFSTLFAPVVMLAHSGFVFTILGGFAAGWSTQHRQDRALPLGLVVRQFWPHTLAGIVAAALLYGLAPQILGWFVPLLAGLLFSIPLVAITSSIKLGRAAAAGGLFLAAGETAPAPVITDANRLMATRMAYREWDFPRLVLADREVQALHLQLLRETPPANDIAPERLAELAAAAREGRTGHFSRQDWIALLSDAESLKAAQG